MKPVLLAIMDGYALSEPGPGNAISLADTPFLDECFSTCPHISLQASGLAVGLPEGQMGNSEVGHLNIGAGRIVNQELTRINKACEDGSLAENEVLIDAFDAAITAGRPIHFLGLLSDGGVHSNIEHLEALMTMAAERGAQDLRVHAFMDGRDVDPKSGAGYLQRIVDFSQALTEAHPQVQVEVATISGRYYAMDRDKRWERVQLAYNAIVCGSGKQACSADPVAVAEASYADDVTDEFVIPTVLDERGITDGDTVVFYNFRPDRAREMTRAIVDADFDGFERARRPEVQFVCLTEYDPSIPAPIAFPKTFPENTLADYLAQQGLRQLHIAETEKYAHVTFFFNGGIEEPKESEQRILVASPKVATYDLQPEMSAPEVTDRLEAAIRDDAADVYILNYANCDMVGHTGVIDATVKAVEAVDAGLKRVVGAILDKAGAALIGADHGNADRMLCDDGVSPFTAHTTARVPFMLVCNDPHLSLAPDEDACLADIAPTLVDVLGLDKPREWSGVSRLISV